MQRSARSNSGIKRNFNGGEDQDRMKSLSEISDEIIPPCGILIFYLNWMSRKKLNKIPNIVGNNNLTYYQPVFDYLSFCEIDVPSFRKRRFEQL